VKGTRLRIQGGCAVLKNNFNVLNLKIFKIQRYFEKIEKYPTLGVIIVLLLGCGVFSILSDRFLTSSNFISVMTRVSELGIVTIGITFLMISGEFDLSVGGVYAISGFLFAKLANLGLPSPIALAITLGVASSIGFVNGIVTVYRRIPSFITTLGMMMFLRGSLLGITKGSSIYYKGDETIPTILSGTVGYNIRSSHFWFIGMILLFTFILNSTAYGNWVFSTGGNREAARLSGVNINKVKLINFIISAILAGLTGCIVLGRFRVIAPAFGEGIELEVIAASVIGGTLLMGGYGTIIGGALGALLIGIVRNGLVLSGAPPYWYRSFIGIILVVAAMFHLKRRE